MIRSNYAAQGALEVINLHKMYKKYIDRGADKEADVLKRVDAFRTFRNNKVLEAIPVMLDIVADPAEDEYLRTVCAEVLGWYLRSVEKDQILEALNATLEKGVESEKVRKEIIKTIKRLN